MLDDMSIDLLNYLEYKILLSSDEWDGSLKDKRDQLLKKQTQ
jgi:hypothetical protein